jgi:hypothetical protein
VKDIKTQHFDDDALENALRILGLRFNDKKSSRAYIVTMSGYIDLFLTSLKNLAENVMLAACETVFILLSKEEGALDMFYRRGGVSILSDCLSDYNP